MILRFAEWWRKMASNKMSAHSLARNWWLIVLRGLFAILFGLAALAWPNFTVISLAPLLGVYLLIDGLVAVFGGFTRYHGSQPWWLLLIEGSLGLFAGGLIFLAPNLAVISLLYLIAAWAVGAGIVKMVAAIRLRAEVGNEGLLALSGVLAVVFGIVLVIWPGPSAAGLVGVIGAYTLVSGLLLIALGFRLWNWQRSASLTALRPVRLGGRRPPSKP